MSVRQSWGLLLIVMGCAGCGSNLTTEAILHDLKSPRGAQRLKAVRELGYRQGEASTIVPELIESLRDRQAMVRWNAANALGSRGEQARPAIAALQEAREDSDVRVREAAGNALCRIDPHQFPANLMELPGNTK